MLARAAVLFLILASPALAQSQTYLPQSSLAACLARAHQQCRLVSTLSDGSLDNCRTLAEDPTQFPPGCDLNNKATWRLGGCTPSPDITQYWWYCQPLTAAVSGNTTGLEIRPGDPNFDKTTTNALAKSPTGLTAPEQAALLSRNALGTALPDIITEPAFIARFTPVQQTAIAANATCGIQWNNIKAAALVDFQSASVQALLTCLVGQNLIPASQVVTITAPTAVLANP